MLDRISICEALAKRNEIDPFLKRMVTGDEKWVTYYNIVQKRSWSKYGEATQTVARKDTETLLQASPIALPVPQYFQLVLTPPSSGEIHCLSSGTQQCCP
ncbi:hypothetical protein TNCV_3567491 [Trichonephila clavipes]|nr:hypothetical protein TNCV_3567491 [Trichonephila clavipes]